MAEPQALAQGTVGCTRSHSTPDPARMDSCQTHLSDGSPAHMAEDLQYSKFGF